MCTTSKCLLFIIIGRCRKKMVRFCAVVGCGNRSDRDEGKNSSASQVFETEEADRYQGGKSTEGYGSKASIVMTSQKAK